MTTAYTLDFSLVSSNNQELFIKLSDWYSPPVKGELLEVAQVVDINQARNDYLTLIDQIRNILNQTNLLENQAVLSAINNALMLGDFSKISASLETLIQIDVPEIGEGLIPQLSQLCNIYRVFEMLNAMPGTSGQSINIFKLPGII